MKMVVAAVAAMVITSSAAFAQPAPTPTPRPDGLKFTCTAAGLGEQGPFARQIRNTIRSQVLLAGVNPARVAIHIDAKDVQRPVVYVDRSIARGDLPLSIRFNPLVLTADQNAINYEDPARAGCTVKREFTVTVRHGGKSASTKFQVSAPGTYQRLGVKN